MLTDRRSLVVLSNQSMWKHLVIGQEFSLLFIGQFSFLCFSLVTILEERLLELTETGIITESDRNGPNLPNRTRLCGPCIAAKAGSYTSAFVG